MTASYVSSQSGNAAPGTNEYSLGVTVGTAVSTGNTVFVWAVGGGGLNNGSSWTCSDNVSGNTYTLLDDAYDGSWNTTALFVCYNAVNSPTTFTVGFGGQAAQYPCVAVDTFTGTPASATLDVTGSINAQVNPGTGTDAITSGSFTPSASGELLYCASTGSTGSGTQAVGTGWTSAQSNLEGAVCTEYVLSGTTSAQAGTWTDSNGGGESYVTVAVAIKAAAAIRHATVSETLGTLTLSGTLTKTDKASVSKTLGTLTLSATLTKTDKGTVSKTLGALLSTTTLSSTVKATGSDTLGALTLEASGSPGGIDLVSTSFVQWAARTNTTITAPTGIQDGDLLVIHFVLEEYTEDPVTAPTGFTLIPGPTYPVTSSNPGGSANLDNRLYYKIASGESGDYTFTHIAGASAAWMACFSGNDLLNPVTNASSATGTGATTTVPGITTTANGSLVVFTQQDYGYKELNNNLSGPTGFTPLSTWAEVNNLYASTYTQPTLGATGSLSITNDNGATSFGWAGFQFAINPPPTFAGKLSEPLGALTVDATGVFAVELVERATLGVLGVYSTGTVNGFGGTAETLGSLTLSATGHLTSHATASDTLGTLTVVATGTFKETDHFTASVTLGTATLVARMASDDPGNLSRVLGALTLVATATRPAHATLSQILGVATGSGTLSPIDKLTGSKTLAALTMVGTVHNLATDHFTLTATLGAVTATFITAKTKFDTVNARTYLTVTGYQPGTPPIQTLRVS